MNKETRQLRKESAQEQIKLLTLLVQAIDAADEFHDQVLHKDALIAQYSHDLQHALQRIDEQSKTIQSKEAELEQALSELQQLKSAPSLEQLDKEIKESEGQ